MKRGKIDYEAGLKFLLDMKANFDNLYEKKQIDVHLYNDFLNFYNMVGKLHNESIKKEDGE